jgi:DNA primase
MPLIDFHQVRAEVHLTTVLELLGWQGQHSQGEQVRGPCPVHGSSSPRSRSFSAQLQRNVWRCFVCQAGGNALDLWVQASKLPLYAAVLKLYRQLGRAVSWLQPLRLASGNQDQRGVRPMSD